MRRLIAIALFAAGGLAAEIVHPAYGSCIAQSGVQAVSKRRASGKEIATDD
ncbi:hypothetical protein [Paraburkholderia sp. J41]|uniref:hypothetical protein n=1 Tax=Paraburkholderia sp. J41 TaxID=2805433 RepID=UPI002AC315C5|nr:hypothetical protein [Paraburkholderia sp. J41]